MSTYQQARSTRREGRTITGKFRSGKLNPVMATAIRPSEGGMLSQEVTMELDPIAGRMITPITAQMISVFVPVQAADYLRDPDAAYAGMTEVLRTKLLTGTPLFGVEAEGEISQRCGVTPRSIGGVKSVNRIVRNSHNAAVNFLRTRKYHKATKITSANTVVTPALIGRTILERMNGVLDPDDRINGEVQLSLPEVKLPVQGITQASNVTHGAQNATIIADATAQKLAYGANFVNIKRKDGNPAGTELDVFVQLNEVAAGGLSLQDLYNAEKADRLVRTMDGIMTDNPEYGPEMVLRWAHGLSVDPGRMPYILSEQEQVFGGGTTTATDTAGTNARTMRTDRVLSMRFMVPIPKTELGGIVITFCTVKPDETLSHQPHPILSDVWGLDNFVADEMALDPVPVTIRDLFADCTAAQESTVALYVGNNALKADYRSYGLARNVNPTTIENKTRIWQLEIPISVTPDNILYPATLVQYPFADQHAEICTYTVTSQLVLKSPIIYGPTPVETHAVVDQILEDN